jgi:hypothetical protein
MKILKMAGKIENIPSKINHDKTIVTISAIF